MAERDAAHGRHAWLLAAVLLPAALAASGSRAGDAQDTAALYQETVITTGSDLRYRADGFSRAFRIVLVKVSGESRLDHDPRVDRLAKEAGLFVASFGYVDQMAGIKHKDDQGTYDRPFNLTVHFVPAMIDRALTGLGAHPWRGTRPVVVPVLAVRGVSAAYLLTEDGPAGADQRAALVAAADDFALSVRFPTDGEMAAWHVALGSFPSPPAAPAPDRVVVSGTLEFQEVIPGWVGAWRMRWHGVDYTWGIRGVNFDGAFRNLIRGVARAASGHGAPE
ncbi:MAG TPA: DUF2066 domain-containing protein [bacterium]|nr:DUF2066 domain-containing protein [bacterium]